MAMGTETTFIDDANVHVCDNCGAIAPEIKNIKHYDNCKKGECKKWEKYYAKNSK